MNLLEQKYFKISDRMLLQSKVYFTKELALIKSGKCAIKYDSWKAINELHLDAVEKEISNRKLKK